MGTYLFSFEEKKRRLPDGNHLLSIPQLYFPMEFSLKNLKEDRLRLLLLDLSYRFSRKKTDTNGPLGTFAIMFFLVLFLSEKKKNITWYLPNRQVWEIPRKKSYSIL